MKLKELEILLVEHLKESGQIRADLAWLKKAHWLQSSAILSAIVTALGIYLARGH